MPKVSIVVPNYNHERFLAQRMDSILAQTFADFEVVVLDDASTDNSVEVLGRYLTDPRVKPILRNSRNTGIPFAQWNNGVRAACGDYVWIAESDDYAAPQLLQTLVRVLDAHPTVGVAYCQSTAVDTEGEPLFSLKDWTDDIDSVKWSRDYVNRGCDECAQYLAIKTTIPNASAAVFRREVYLDAGGADATFRLAGDRMLWAKLMLRSDVAFNASHLNYFRVHPGSVRSRSTRTRIALDEAMRVYSYIEARVEVPAEARRSALDRMVSRWAGEATLHPFDLGRHLRVYRQLRTLDSSLKRSLIGRLSSAVLGRIGIGPANGPRAESQS